MDISSEKLRKIAHKMIFLFKENLKIETESLFLVAQNNVIRINYAEAKLDTSQEM